MDRLAISVRPLPATMPFRYEAHHAQQRGSEYQKPHDQRELGSMGASKPDERGHSFAPALSGPISIESFKLTFLAVPVAATSHDTTMRD